jgi:hypothetical protein
MFAAPPANAAAAVTLLRHCVALLQSDMLLLRQLGGAGLWLLLVQVTDYEVVNPELVDVLRQVSRYSLTGRWRYSLCGSTVLPDDISLPGMKTCSHCCLQVPAHDIEGASQCFGLCCVFISAGAD